MRPLTILLIAMGFAAGLAVGMSGPIAKAGEGLARMINADAPASGPLVRVTATSGLQHEGFQPADVRWNPRQDLNLKTICAPNGLSGPSPLPAIQHL